MPPKQGAPKRKTTADDGGGSSKKAAVGTNRDSTSHDQSTKDDTPNLSGLPADVLYAIFENLSPPDRYNLSVTCGRLYDVEQRAPGQRRVACAHLAIRHTVELDSSEECGGGVRVSSRLRGADSMKTKDYLECVGHSGVRCLAHETVDATAKCSLTLGPPTRTFDAFAPKFADRALFYYKISLEQAPAFILALSKTTKADCACVTMNMRDLAQHDCLDSLRGLVCPSVGLAHGKPKTTIDRASNVECVEETAALPQHVYCDLPYFHQAQKLLLSDLSLEQGQFQEFFEGIKRSSLSHLAMIYDQEKVATAQGTDLVKEVMPWALTMNTGPKIPHIWSDFYKRGVRDGRWLLRTVSKAPKRRLIIQRV